MRQPDSQEAPPKNQNREMNSASDELTEELTRDELTEDLKLHSQKNSNCTHRRTVGDERDMNSLR